MSKEQRFRPILGNGESMVEPVKPARGAGEPDYPRTYNEAKSRIKKQVSNVIQAIEALPNEKRMQEVVITIRLHYKFLAKSYTPTMLFREINAENVGSRRWDYSDELKKDIYYSKMHFVKASVDNLIYLQDYLDKDEAVLKDSFKKDIQKIEEISLLSSSETIVGFEDEWLTGKVEMVLHPFEDEMNLAVEKFMAILIANDVAEESIKVKIYNNGPTFICANMNRQALSAIHDFNPLRTAHPIRMNTFPEMRNVRYTPNAPSPVSSSVRSRIKIGMFDGGVDGTIPLLANHVSDNQVLNTLPEAEYIEHGSAVAGCILYGPLNRFNDNENIPQPTVSVESFRVFPLNNRHDYELYEAIDIIENVVPSRNDIQVYNLSFGPYGPILDDEISRFTYVLDNLAWNYQKLFIVAVGNDGDLQTPMNRIQSPSDMVNGLGVGAFSYDSTGNVIRAPYSCIGQGREGCKVKPDILAFGGDEVAPIEVVSVHHGNRSLTTGTSYAAPVISGMAGEILGRCDRFNPLVARALLVHSATNPNGVCKEFGYGFLNKPIEQIINCTDNNVTIVYTSSIMPKNYAKIPIPIPLTAQSSGKFKISYTIAVLSKVNPLHVEDYTESAIEDTFYPHDQRFRFTKGKSNVIKNIETDTSEIEKLLSQGYQSSTLPVSTSTKTYQTEQARRGELKWDTVVHRWRTMKSASLRKPFLVLHGMGRNSGKDRMDYALIVTISALDYKTSLYNDILTEYTTLQPVQLRATNELMVHV